MQNRDGECCWALEQDNRSRNKKGDGHREMGAWLDIGGGAGSEKCDKSGSQLGAGSLNRQQGVWQGAGSGIDSR